MLSTKWQNLISGMVGWAVAIWLVACSFSMTSYTDNLFQPAFVPRVLAGLLALCGSIVIIQALVRDKKDKAAAAKAAAETEAADANAAAADSTAAQSAKESIAEVVAETLSETVEAEETEQAAEAASEAQPEEAADGKKARFLAFLHKTTPYLTFGLIFLYLLIMPYLGFTISTVLYLFAQITLLSNKRGWKNLLFYFGLSVVIGVIVFFAFAKGFNLSLPVNHWRF